MPKQIDTPGVYIADVLEHSLGLTKKNSYPQFIGRFGATKKWVDDKAGMEHFEMVEPGWVDWTVYEEYLVGYLVLFNNAEAFDETSAMFNYEQLKTAVGWSGQDFADLNGDKYVGKPVLIRVEENTYEGKTNLQVNWIDHEDAPPTRELRVLDGDVLKGLTAKLNMRKAAVKPAVATAKPKPTPVTDVASPKTKVKAKATPTVEEDDIPFGSEPPADDSPPIAKMTKEESWKHVHSRKGETPDNEISGAWLDAVAEIAEQFGSGEDSFTPKEWAEVATIVVRDLAL